jgi:hypothetical protein
MGSAGVARRADSAPTSRGNGPAKARVTGLSAQKQIARRQKKKNHCHTRATGTASHHHRFSLKKSQHHRTWRLHKSDPSCRAQRTSVAGGSAHPRRLRWQLEEKRNQMVVSQLV